MKRLLSQIVVAGCLAALLAAPVLAQKDASQPNRDLEMAEDMEIMGRLLEEALEAVYRQPNGGPVGSIVNRYGEARLWFGVGVTGVPSKGAASADLVREPLSVYLGGQGVIFQTEAPAFQSEMHVDSLEVKANECPFLSRSSWDQMRMRLQNANASRENCKGCHHDPEAPSWLVQVIPHLERENHKRPTKEALVDTLLQSLAENGHNVRHLKPEERITFALTFRPDENADTIVSREKQEKERTNLNNQINEVLRKAQAKQIDLVKRGFAHPDSLPSGNAQPLAGYLLLKTHQYNRAIEAYQKALEGSGVKDLFQHTPDVRQRRIYRQLLQAHVGAGNLKEAQKLIAILRASEVKATPAKKSPPPLPARLVVSATKAQLDQVAGGEMSREEFAKQAKVQFLEGRGTKPSKQSKGDWKDLIDPITGGILYDAAQIEHPLVRP